jgi:hypothetical protein
VQVILTLLTTFNVSGKAYSDPRKRDDSNPLSTFKAAPPSRSDRRASMVDADRHLDSLSAGKNEGVFRIGDLGEIELEIHFEIRVVNSWESSINTVPKTTRIIETEPSQLDV